MTMLGVAKQMPNYEVEQFTYKFEHWKQSCENGTENRDLLILPICRQNRHRSVAFRKLALKYLPKKVPRGYQVIEGPEPNFARHMCAAYNRAPCKVCTHEDKSWKDKLDEAYTTFDERMDKSLENRYRK